MANNTLSNVPRELKPCPFCGGDAETDTHTEECYFTVSKNFVAHNADMSLVSAVLRAWNQRAPSPAGVDGLEVAAMPDEVFAGEFADWWDEDGKYVRAGGGQYEKSFAFQAWRHLMPMVASNQAIIDGLRGEADQQAQRIGELASHLEFAVTMLTVAGLAGNAQVEAMRAALSAGVGRVK